MEQPDIEPTKDVPRSKRIIHLVCHIMFHIIFISFFIYATVVYILFDPNDSECTDPEKNIAAPAPPAVPAVPVEPGVPAEPEVPVGPGGKKYRYARDLYSEYERDAPDEEEYIYTGLANAYARADDNQTAVAWTPNILCEYNNCTGYGMLVILFIIFYIVWIYYWLFKPYIGKKLYNKFIEPLIDRWIGFSRKFSVSLAMLLIVIALVIAYLGYECRHDGSKSIGISAPILFILIGYLVSTDRKAIPWRIVVHGLLGQLILGIFVIRLKTGRDILECIADKAVLFLQNTDVGARFVYGDRICDEYVFAFPILAVIFFFSVITSILYYFGAMQFVLGAFGYFVQATVGTTVCESVNAVGNIFLGMSESPMIIRPYINILTKSSVLGAFISFGASAAYLITASVMAAPGSLAYAKLFYPETEVSQTSTETIILEKSEDKSILDAALSGAANALIIVLGIVSNIIAFLAIVNFLNSIVEWLFELLNHEGVTFIYILTKVFIPLVFLMGVPSYDCEQVAKVVAEKTVINEFVAYKNLGDMIKSDDNNLDNRSIIIATFALCGFANPGSLGILIASLSAMAPSRRIDITRVAVRAFFTGSIVSFTSAAFAGILIQGDELIKSK